MTMAGMTTLGTFALNSCSSNASNASADISPKFVTTTSTSDPLQTVEVTIPQSTPVYVHEKVEVRSTWKAMTWSVLDIVILNGKPYALFGADALTNPYNGDTDINAVLPLLGIKNMNLPKPARLPTSSTTNGGALRGSWSGAKAIAVPDIRGNSLTSQSIADEKCRNHGLKMLGEDGFRMAEFHDGDKTAGMAGWDFWADASAIDVLQVAKIRYWVQINDQNANPWR